MNDLILKELESWHKEALAPFENFDDENFDENGFWRHRHLLGVCLFLKPVLAEAREFELLGKVTAIEIDMQKIIQAESDEIEEYQQSLSDGFEFSNKLDRALSKFYLNNPDLTVDVNRFIERIKSAADEIEDNESINGLLNYASEESTLKRTRQKAQRTIAQRVYAEGNSRIPSEEEMLAEFKIAREGIYSNAEKHIANTLKRVGS